MFISKKQKQRMRERRKKKRRALCETNGCSHDHQQHDRLGEQDASKKPHIDDGDLHSQNGVGSGQPSSAEAPDSFESRTLKEVEVSSSSSFVGRSFDGKMRVHIPENLRGKEARKFRKDTRRRARIEGVNEKDIVFVEDNQNPSSSSDATNKNPINRKRTREFPNINKLVEDEKERSEKRAKKEALAKLESEISDEIKDQYRAVDCEMVGIGREGRISALARVSVTDWSGEVLLDTFVQVPSKVTDFRTRWSGVSARHLKADTAISPEQCRTKVASLLKGKILVGHALKNDLDALMLKHSKDDIRDTAKYRPYQRLAGKKWRPRKLRDLVKEHCNIDIQREGESHDSVDDARAAMELYRVARTSWEADLERKSKKKLS